MGNHVFICYARKDKEFVLKLARILRERGVPVWLDVWDIPAGANYNLSIDQAIEDCARFLLVLSPAARESREVEGEWLFALQENKLIIPVLYQPCRIPRQLLTLQRVDFSTSSLEDEETLQQLVSVLAERQSTRPENIATAGRHIDPVQPEEVAKPQATIRNSIGMELVLIPAGEFRMGAENGRDDETPVHLVRISQPFYLGKCPVTQAQWEAVMGTNPSRFRDDPSLPVENVSWHDVQEFLQRLSVKEGGLPYRLPTEAEWEYAARAGTATSYCFGEDSGQLREYAWYQENAGGTTHPVGQLKPNAWGLYDVHGNVWEWIQDWYDATYYQRSPAEDPRGPEEGQYRVVRGGSWSDVPGLVRVSTRRWRVPGYRLDYVGFRCAR